MNLSYTTLRSYIAVLKHFSGVFSPEKVTLTNSKSIKNKELRLQDTMMTINESLINISILDQWSKKLLNL